MARFPRFKSHKFREQKFKMIWKRPRVTKQDVEEYRSTSGNRKIKAKDIEISGKVRPNPKIMWIAPNLPVEKLLETTIHESLHACYWDLDENAIDEGTKSIMGLFKKMGMKVTFGG